MKKFKFLKSFLLSISAFFITTGAVVGGLAINTAKTTSKSQSAPSGPILNSSLLGIPGASPNSIYSMDINFSHPFSIYIENVFRQSYYKSAHTPVREWSIFIYDQVDKRMAVRKIPDELIPQEFKGSSGHENLFFDTVSADGNNIYAVHTSLGELWSYSLTTGKFSKNQNFKQPFNDNNIVKLFKDSGFTTQEINDLNDWGTPDVFKKYKILSDISQYPSFKSKNKTSIFSSPFYPNKLFWNNSKNGYLFAFDLLTSKWELIGDVIPGGKNKGPDYRKGLSEFYSNPKTNDAVNNSQTNSSLSKGMFISKTWGGANVSKHNPHIFYQFDNLSGAILETNKKTGKRVLHSAIKKPSNVTTTAQDWSWPLSEQIFGTQGKTGWTLTNYWFETYDDSSAVNWNFFESPDKPGVFYTSTMKTAMTLKTGASDGRYIIKIDASDPVGWVKTSVTDVLAEAKHTKAGDAMSPVQPSGLKPAGNYDSAWELFGLNFFRVPGTNEINGVAMGPASYYEEYDSNFTWVPSFNANFKINKNDGEIKDLDVTKNFNYFLKDFTDPLDVGSAYNWFISSPKIPSAMQGKNDSSNDAARVNFMPMFSNSVPPKLSGEELLALLPQYSSNTDSFLDSISSGDSFVNQVSQTSFASKIMPELRGNFSENWNWGQGQNPAYTSKAVYFGPPGSAMRTKFLNDKEGHPGGGLIEDRSGNIYFNTGNNSKLGDRGQIWKLNPQNLTAIKRLDNMENASLTWTSNDSGDLFWSSESGHFMYDSSSKKTKQLKSITKTFGTKYIKAEGRIFRVSDTGESILEMDTLTGKLIPGSEILTRADIHQTMGIPYLKVHKTANSAFAGLASLFYNKSTKMLYFQNSGHKYLMEFKLGELLEDKRKSTTKPISHYLRLLKSGIKQTSQILGIKKDNSTGKTLIYLATQTGIKVYDLQTMSLEYTFNPGSTPTDFSYVNHALLRSGKVFVIAGGKDVEGWIFELRGKDSNFSPPLFTNQVKKGVIKGTYSNAIETSNGDIYMSFWKGKSGQSSLFVLRPKAKQMSWNKGLFLNQKKFGYKTPKVNSIMTMFTSVNNLNSGLAIFGSDPSNKNIMSLLGTYSIALDHNAIIEKPIYSRDGKSLIFTYNKYSGNDRGIGNVNSKNNPYAYNDGTDNNTHKHIVIVPLDHTSWTNKKVSGVIDIDLDDPSVGTNFLGRVPSLFGQSSDQNTTVFDIRQNVLAYDYDTTNQTLLWADLNSGELISSNLNTKQAVVLDQYEKSATDWQNKIKSYFPSNYTTMLRDNNRLKRYLETVNNEYVKNFDELVTITRSGIPIAVDLDKKQFAKHWRAKPYFDSNKLVGSNDYYVKHLIGLDLANKFLFTTGKFWNDPVIINNDFKVVVANSFSIEKTIEKNTANTKHWDGVIDDISKKQYFTTEVITGQPIAIKNAVWIPVITSGILSHTIYVDLRDNNIYSFANEVSSIMHDALKYSFKPINAVGGTWTGQFNETAGNTFLKISNNELFAFADVSMARIFLKKLMTTNLLNKNIGLLNLKSEPTRKKGVYHVTSPIVLPEYLWFVTEGTSDNQGNLHTTPQKYHKLDFYSTYASLNKGIKIWIEVDEHHPTIKYYKTVYMIGDKRYYKGSNSQLYDYLVKINSAWDEKTIKSLDRLLLAEPVKATFKVHGTINLIAMPIFTDAMVKTAKSTSSIGVISYGAIPFGGKNVNLTVQTETFLRSGDAKIQGLPTDVDSKLEIEIFGQWVPVIGSSVSNLNPGKYKFRWVPKKKTDVYYVGGKFLQASPTFEVEIHTQKKQKIDSSFIFVQSNTSDPNFVGASDGSIRISIGKYAKWLDIKYRKKGTTAWTAVPANLVVSGLSDGEYEFSVVVKPTSPNFVIFDGSTQKFVSRVIIKTIRLTEKKLNMHSRASAPLFGKVTKTTYQNTNDGSVGIDLTKMPYGAWWDAKIVNTQTNQTFKFTYNTSTKQYNPMVKLGAGIYKIIITINDPAKHAFWDGTNFIGKFYVIEETITIGSTNPVDLIKVKNQSALNKFLTLNPQYVGQSGTISGIVSFAPFGYIEWQDPQTNVWTRLTTAQLTSRSITGLLAGNYKFRLVANAGYVFESEDGVQKGVTQLDINGKNGTNVSTFITIVQSKISIVANTNPPVWLTGGFDVDFSKITNPADQIKTVAPSDSVTQDGEIKNVPHLPNTKAQIFIKGIWVDMTKVGTTYEIKTLSTGTYQIRYIADPQYQFLIKSAKATIGYSKPTTVSVPKTSTQVIVSIPAIPQKIDAESYIGKHDARIERFTSIPSTELFYALNLANPSVDAKDPSKFTKKVTHNAITGLKGGDIVYLMWKVKAGSSVIFKVVDPNDPTKKIDATFASTKKIVVPHSTITGIDDSKISTTDKLNVSIGLPQFVNTNDGTLTIDSSKFPYDSHAKIEIIYPNGTRVTLKQDKTDPTKWETLTNISKGHYVVNINANPNSVFKSGVYFIKFEFDIDAKIWTAHGNRTLSLISTYTKIPNSYVTGNNITTPKYNGSSTGELNGLPTTSNTDLFYSGDNGKTWKLIGNNSVLGLLAGNYKIKIKAKTGYLILDKNKVSQEEIILTDEIVPTHLTIPASTKLVLKTPANSSTWFANALASVKAPTFIGNQDGQISQLPFYGGASTSANASDVDLEIELSGIWTKVTGNIVNKLISQTYRFRWKTNHSNKTYYFLSTTNQTLSRTEIISVKIVVPAASTVILGVPSFFIGTNDVIKPNYRGDNSGEIRSTTPNPHTSFEYRSQPISATPGAWVSIPKTQKSINQLSSGRYAFRFKADNGYIFNYLDTNGIRVKGVYSETFIVNIPPSSYTGINDITVTQSNVANIKGTLYNNLKDGEIEINIPVNNNLKVTLTNNQTGVKITLTPDPTNPSKYAKVTGLAAGKYELIIETKSGFVFTPSINNVKQYTLEIKPITAKTVVFSKQIPKLKTTMTAPSYRGQADGTISGINPVPNAIVTFTDSKGVRKTVKTSFASVLSGTYNMFIEVDPANPNYVFEDPNNPGTYVNRIPYNDAAGTNAVIVPKSNIEIMDSTQRPTWTSSIKTQSPTFRGGNDGVLSGFIPYVDRSDPKFTTAVDLYINNAGAWVKVTPRITGLISKAYDFKWVSNNPNYKFLDANGQIVSELLITKKVLLPQSTTILISVLPLFNLNNQDADSPTFINGADGKISSIPQTTKWVMEYRSFTTTGPKKPWQSIAYPVGKPGSSAVITGLVAGVYEFRFVIKTGGKTYRFKITDATQPSGFRSENTYEDPNGTFLVTVPPSSFTSIPNITGTSISTSTPSTYNNIKDGTLSLTIPFNKDVDITIIGQDGKSITAVQDPNNPKAYKTISNLAKGTFDIFVEVKPGALFADGSGVAKFQAAVNSKNNAYIIFNNKINKLKATFVKAPTYIAAGDGQILGISSVPNTKLMYREKGVGLWQHVGGNNSLRALQGGKTYEFKIEVDTNAKVKYLIEDAKGNYVTSLPLVDASGKNEIFVPASTLQPITLPTWNAPTATTPTFEGNADAVISGLAQIPNADLEILVGQKIVGGKSVDDWRTVTGTTHNKLPAGLYIFRYKAHAGFMFLVSGSLYSEYLDVNIMKITIGKSNKRITVVPKLSKVVLTPVPPSSQGAADGKISSIPNLPGMVVEVASAPTGPWKELDSKTNNFKAGDYYFRWRVKTGLKVTYNWITSADYKKGLKKYSTQPSAPIKITIPSSSIKLLDVPQANAFKLEVTEPSFRDNDDASLILKLDMNALSAKIKANLKNYIIRIIAADGSIYELNKANNYTITNKEGLVPGVVTIEVVPQTSFEYAPNQFFKDIKVKIPNSDVSPPVKWVPIIIAAGSGLILLGIILMMFIKGNIVWLSTSEKVEKRLSKRNKK